MKKILILSIAASFLLLSNVYSKPINVFCDSAETVQALSILDNIVANTNNNINRANGFIKAATHGLGIANLHTEAVASHAKLLSEGHKLLNDNTKTLEDTKQAISNVHKTFCVANSDDGHKSPYTIQNGPE